MKIGIYTFLTKNYGAVLQAFSLYRTVTELCPGASVRIVDFRTARHESISKIFCRRSDNNLYNLVWQLHILWHYRELKHRRDAIRDFKNRMDFTARYETIQALLDNPPVMDVHITGSDQVFRPNFEYRDVYYLNFSKGSSRKVAYAPSFGVNRFTDQEKAYIKSALSDFDALSCRERSGAEFMHELLGKPVFHALDPVFLTSQTEWRSVAVEPNINDDYMFVYCLKDVSRLLEYARLLYPGRQIVLLAPNNLRHYSGCKQLFYPGPQEFIGLIDNAAAVVTDSFHGTAFSIIFRKEFRTVITRPEVSSRIESLLGSLGLEDRIMTESVKTGVKPLAEHEYSSKLAEMIESSREYLRTSLQLKSESHETE